MTVAPVPPEEQPVWDATMAAEHGMGFRRAFGAHQRYWSHGQFEGRPVILGALLFAAPARHVACRDTWLGWGPLQRKRFRQRLVANSRLLIRAGVAVPHLASHALALALRRLPEDWRLRFGYAPVVVETFVSAPWRGTCYRAANWVHLGQTTGQGRQDRRHGEPGSVKEVFAYPLVADAAAPGLHRHHLVPEPRQPITRQRDDPIPKPLLLLCAPAQPHVPHGHVARRRRTEQSARTSLLPSTSP